MLVIDPVYGLMNAEDIINIQNTAKNWIFAGRKKMDRTMRLNICMMAPLLLCLHGVGLYGAYVDHSFDYVITADGTKDFTTYPDQTFKWDLTATATETWDTTTVTYFTKRVEKPASWEGGSITKNGIFIPVVSGIATFSAEYAGSSNSSGEFAIGIASWPSGLPTGDVYSSEWRSDSSVYIRDVQVGVVAGQIYYIGFRCGTVDCDRLWISIEYPSGQTNDPHTAQRTAKDSGYGTVNETEGNKFISSFSAYPQPQQGGTMSTPSYSVINDNANVSTWTSGNDVRASTNYLVTQRQAWSDTEPGSSSVNASEGDKPIAKSTLIAPNYDTQWSVSDYNSIVKTWMVGNQLYASVILQFGDISGNGTVSSADAAMAARYAVGLIALTPAQIVAADVTGNGEVTATDAAWIARYVVGLENEFPVENITN